MSVRIKICGLTRAADVEAAEALGADAIGVNFHHESPRYVDPRAARGLIQAASPLMACVGVWVMQPLRQVCATAYQLGLRGVQWYGGVADTSDPFPFSMLSAFRVKEAAQLHAIDAYLQACRSAGWSPRAVLVDSLVAGAMGGTGHTAPWGLLASWRPAVPLILAGGLTPENVAAAIRQVRPAGVDVASGVESSPGVKDRVKMRDFIQAARAAAADAGPPDA